MSIDVIYSLPLNHLIKIENREVIKKWGQKAGKIIQRKVVQNCKQVFEENGLEYDQEDLLVAKGNDDFAKECYENMKNILSEVEG